MALAIMSCTDFPEVPYSERVEPYLDPRDFYEYKIIVIGNQTWMAENMRLTKDVSFTCLHGNLQNCNKYGPLYEFTVANAVCPDGWKLPSNEEWETLVKNTGGTANSGYRLKAKTGWEHEGNGSDMYSFNALPGGFIDNHNQSYYEGEMALWWSSTELETSILARGIYYEKWEGAEIVRVDTPKTAKHSVRCLKEN